MSDWQPIETAPRDGTAILAFGYGYMGFGYGFMAVVEWHGLEWDGRWIFTVSGDRVEDCQYQEDCQWEPTHWQDLPEPPEGNHER